MALKKRGRPTKAGNHKVRKTGRVTLQCLFCHADGSVDADTSRFICSNCVIDRVGGSALPAAVKAKTETKTVKLNKDGTPRKKRSPNGSRVIVVKSTGRGRGWHLKAYFHDTNTDEHFSFGEKLTDKKKIASAKRAAEKKASKR